MHARGPVSPAPRLLTALHTDGARARPSQAGFVLRRGLELA